MPHIALPFDSYLEHRAVGSAAVTATTVLDTIDLTAATRTVYMTRAIVEAIKISANDEQYTLVIEVDDSSAFSSPEVAAMLILGATEVRQSGAPDNAAGDVYDLYWSNEVNQVVYQHWRAKLFTTGTSETITLACYSSVVGGV